MGEQDSQHDFQVGCLPLVMNNKSERAGPLEFSCLTTAAVAGRPNHRQISVGRVARGRMLLSPTADFQRSLGMRMESMRQAGCIPGTFPDHGQYLENAQGSGSYQSEGNQEISY
jgi:hypothetical protein